MSPQRLYGPCVLGALATGGIATFAASRSWAHATVAAQGVPSDRINVSGTDAVGVVPALALVVVAAALAVLASSIRVRRVVGALIAVVSVIAIVVIVAAGGAIEDAVKVAVHDSPAFIGSNTPSHVGHGVWRWIAALAFAGATFVGLTVARFGGYWPTMGRKYEAPAARASDGAIENETDIWKALDEGRDPTQ